MKILCVDDDQIILKFFQEAVKKLDMPNIELTLLDSGRKAVDTVRESPVDIVILDNKLPDMPGLEVLKDIKRQRPLAEVLMVTGHASIETAVEAMKAGARDYIEKPVRLALLHEKIRNIIELQEREREVEQYRFAKEMMEQGAQREITSLEEAIAAMKTCQARVMAIIDSQRHDAEKIAMVREEITGFGKACG
jgi:DNA-binding NtrC family response regulator